MKSGDTLSCPEILNSGERPTGEVSDLMRLNGMKNLSAIEVAQEMKPDKNEKSFLEERRSYYYFLRASFPRG